MKINYKELKRVCLAEIQDFESLGDVYDTPDGIYIYRENPNAKILAVAHLDTVLNTNHFHHVKVKGDSIVLNAQLDDRLGVYTLLDLLPQLGIQYDLLLTEGEESGCSTAFHFESAKDYNWMFSFDRRGSDVVMYQYDSKELRDDLKQAKFRAGIGSFSDIAFMDHLSVRGMNVGTGYEGEHSTMSYANMRVLQEQIGRFKAYYDLFKDKKYAYVPTPKTYTYGRVDYSTWSKNYPYDDFYCYLCEKHQGKHQVKNDIWLCDACFSDALECEECGDIVHAEDIENRICVACGYDQK